MRSIRVWMVGLSLIAALSGGALFAGGVAEAQPIGANQAREITALANALISFETATRWESMAPAWRARRPGWIARVRAASTPAQLAALTVEVETIMTWQAMYPRWRVERAPWLARARSAVTTHQVAQTLLALEAATTWSGMYRERWAPVRGAWVGALRTI